MDRVKRTESEMFVANDLTRSSLQIFVVGMNGSGTTMLLDALSRSPSVYAFPYESRVIPYLIKKADEVDLTNDRDFKDLFSVIASHPIIVRANAGKKVPFDGRLLRDRRSVASIIDHVFMHFADKESKSIWCEKSPQNVQAIDEILTVFPDAKIIHLIRDGRDCAASLHRRWKRSPELIINRWKKIVAVGEAACHRHEDSCVQIYYESLARAPEKTLRSICEKIGIEFNPSMLESEMPWMEAQGEKKIAFQGYKWKKYFSVSEVARLEAIAGRSLSRHGYEVSLKGEKDIPRYRAMVLRLRDFLRSYFNEIYRKLIGANDKSFGTIVRMPLVSFYEYLAKKY